MLGVAKKYKQQKKNKWFSHQDVTLKFRTLYSEN